MAKFLAEYNPEIGMEEIWKQNPTEVDGTKSRTVGLMERVMQEFDTPIISGAELLASLLKQPEAQIGLRKYRECLSHPLIRFGYRPMDVDGLLKYFSGTHRKEDWLFLTSNFIQQNGPLRKVE